MTICYTYVNTNNVFWVVLLRLGGNDIRYFTFPPDMEVRGGLDQRIAFAPCRHICKFLFKYIPIQ